VWPWELESLRQRHRQLLDEKRSGIGCRVGKPETPTANSFSCPCKNDKIEERGCCSHNFSSMLQVLVLQSFICSKGEALRNKMCRTTAIGWKICHKQRTQAIISP
jgi:hypothetical protein